MELPRVSLISFVRAASEYLDIYFMAEGGRLLAASPFLAAGEKNVPDTSARTQSVLLDCRLQCCIIIRWPALFSPRGGASY